MIVLIVFLFYISLFCVFVLRMLFFFYFVRHFENCFFFLLFSYTDFNFLRKGEKRTLVSFIHSQDDSV